MQLVFSLEDVNHLQHNCHESEQQTSLFLEQKWLVTVK